LSVRLHLCLPACLCLCLSFHQPNPISPPHSSVLYVRNHPLLCDATYQFQPGSPFSVRKSWGFKSSGYGTVSIGK
jgi:hypothetical protein